MDRRAIEVAREIVEYLKRKGINVEKIILFGSRARGDYLIDSDYDFIIISKDFEGIPFAKRIQLVLEATRENVDAICLTPEEFEKERNSLISVVARAVREGVEIEVN